LIALETKSMARILLENVTKVFEGKVTAVHNFNLDVADGEFMVIVGPSGCGKTTTLRMIAGLEEMTSGNIYIGDSLVNDVSPKDRDVAMVFQNYALYPHMNAYHNMAFALKMRNIPRAERLQNYWASSICCDENPGPCPAASASGWLSAEPSFAIPGRSCSTNL